MYTKRVGGSIQICPFFTVYKQFCKQSIYNSFYLVIACLTNRAYPLSQNTHVLLSVDLTASLSLQFSLPERCQCLCVYVFACLCVRNICMLARSSFTRRCRCSVWSWRSHRASRSWKMKHNQCEILRPLSTPILLEKIFMIPYFTSITLNDLYSTFFRYWRIIC